MHRHWTRRLGAVLFGLWFCLAGFDTGVDDACAMQGMAQATPVGMQASVSDAPATDDAHSMPMGTDSDHGSDSGHQHSHRCPCCSCCSVSVLDAPPQRDFLAAAETSPMVPVVRRSSAPDAWVDFILPFPTAPPAGQLA